MSNWNNETRAGFVATFETPQGELVTLHRHGGPKRELMRKAIDDVLARWPGSRLVCYSTPATILSDLLGRAPNISGRPLLPEAVIVAHAGRPELLSPRLEGASPKGSRARRRRRSEREAA